MKRVISAIVLAAVLSIVLAAPVFAGAPEQFPRVCPDQGGGVDKFPGQVGDKAPPHALAHMPGFID